MPCYPFKTADGATGFICTRGRRVKPCVYCGRPSAALCDFPVGETKTGKRKDCDLAMCEGCTQKGVSENVDFCRAHFPVAKAAYERRQAKQAQTV
jgi:hypothetical protein